jgi:hypothetical protein
MFASKLKNRVDHHVKRMRDGNLLVRKASTGRIGKREFFDYLNNLMYFFHHTVIHLDIARTRALALGLNEIVPFLDEKISEETGHEQWARNDLRASGSAQVDVDLGRVAPATHRILAHGVDLIYRDPELFLAYMFFHEYVAVVGGPEFLAHLETQCGIPPERVTALAWHADLDRHHVEEDLMEIQRVVVRSPEKAEPLLEVVDETARFVDDFYAGMVSLLH